MELLTDVTGLEYCLPFKAPLSLVIAGPSFSGKSTFVANLIREKAKMFDPEPEEVIFVYAAWQPLYDELEQTVPNIRFINAIPSKQEIQEMTSDRKHRVFVFDDLMTQLGASANITEYFTIFVHHYNLTCILLIQNIYYQGANCLRDIMLNTQGLVLFRNKRSCRQISTLASQMFLGSKRAWFLQAYERATSKPYGYLYVDLSPHGDETLQLRSHILPGQNTLIYVNGIGK